MGRIYQFLALCAIIPLVTSKCDLETSQRYFKRSMYEFSADLLRRVAEEKDNHFVTSTLSPYSLLTAISFAASGTTLSEIKKVLYHKHQLCFNTKYLALANGALASDESATLERSGAVFVDEAMGLKEDFKKRLAFHGVDITPISFADFSTAAAEINDYVKQATHGVIEDIVTAADLQDIYLMMVDALYFKGQWRSSFPLRNTQASDFFDSDGSTRLGEVNIMYLTTELNITRLEPLQATVLELPYGNTDRFSMLVYLPNVGVSLSTMIDNLKLVSLNSVFGAFSRTGAVTVNVQLPRFKITSDLSNLKDLLEDMGLKAMFDPGQAKFPGLSQYELYVSTFAQKADIEVTEEGTVAAAVTNAGFSFRSSFPDIEFNANRPFFYTIVDRQLQVSIISGAYSKPSLYGGRF